MGAHSKSNPDLQAETREAECEYQQAQADKREAEQNLDGLYRDGDRFAAHPPEGKLANTRAFAGVGIINHLVTKEQQKLAQAEMRVSDAEQKLESKRRERDEAIEADRQADREDRDQLRREMEGQGEGRNLFRERDGDRDHDHDRYRE